MTVVATITVGTQSVNTFFKVGPVLSSVSTILDLNKEQKKQEFQGSEASVPNCSLVEASDAA
jgi:hypothetical protein